MMTRTVCCLVLMLAGPFLAATCSPSCASVVVPRYAQLCHVDPLGLPYASSRAGCPRGPVDAAAVDRWLAAQPRGLRRPATPNVRSMYTGNVLPAAPYGPFAWQSPWSRGPTTYGEFTYQPLPPVPTAPLYRTANRSSYAQPSNSSWHRNEGRLGPPTIYAPFEKPFSSYVPAPAISPYLYASPYIYRDPYLFDPFFLADFYGPAWPFTY